MADIDTLRNTLNVTPAGRGENVQLAVFTVDFDAGDVTMANATDVIRFGTFPAGTLILAGVIEQLTVGTGSGTLVLSAGGVTLSGTLASTAAAGTITQVADVSGGAPRVLATAGEVALTGATAVRNDGALRAMIWHVAPPKAKATEVSRDALA